jgi:hypothetical protein
MNDFPANPVDNMGGIAWFNFFECSQVADLTIRFNNTITENIRLNGTLYKGIVHPNSSRLQIVADSDDNGGFYTITIEGSMGVSKEASLLFAKMLGRDFMVVIADADAMQYLVGKPDEPLSFVWEMETSTASGVKQLKYTFKGVQKNHPPIFNHTSTTEFLFSELFNIKEMALSESFVPTDNIIRDMSGVITSAEILWSDNVPGSISNVSTDGFGVTTMRLNRPYGRYATINITRNNLGNVILKTVITSGYDVEAPDER